MTDDGAPRTASTPGARVQLHTRSVPVVVCLLLFLQLAFPHQAWMALLIGIGLGWWISYRWARSLARGLRVTREMRFGWAQVGDRLEERFTLINDGWAPALWVELIDHSTLPDYQDQANTVTGLSGHSTLQWRTEGQCNRRGLFALGPASLRTGDPLGLYEVTFECPDTSALLVTPPVIPLPTIEIAPGGRAGEGRRSRSALERTVSSSSVRDYVPGDNPKWIHWRVSAHRDTLYVRVFDSSPASDWWVFLDLDQRAQIGQGWDSTAEHGVVLAASLVDQGLRTGQKVGLVTHGRELVWLPPHDGDTQRLSILKALALVDLGIHSLGELLDRAGPMLKQRSSVIIITPDASGQWVKAVVPLVRNGATITALLFDPASFGQRGDLRGARTLLSNLGAKHYTIARELFDRPEARPGKQGQWEWRVMGTGRAVPLRRPHDLDWKRLS